MLEDSDKKHGEGEVLSTALIGGLSVAGAILAGIFLAAATLSPLSPLAAPGVALFSAFSWAAWALPLWALGGAFLLLTGRTGRREALAIGLSSLPFLALAGFARTLSTTSPLFPDLGPDRSRVVAVAFAAAFGGLAVLVAWIVSRPSEGDAADQAETILEEGHRSGLLGEEGAAEEDEEPNGEESAGPIAAGRRPVVEARNATDATDAEFTGALRLPDIPPPPTLRSYRSPAREAITVAEPGTAEVDAEDEGSIEPPFEAPVEESSGNPGVGEAPIPLFFRDEGERAETGGRVELTSASHGGEVGAVIAAGIAVANPGAPAILPALRSGPGVAAAGDTLREIEIVSVPPQPAAQAPEAEKLAIVERILARRKKQPYSVPVAELLEKYPDGEYWIVDEKTRHSAEVLRETLAEFGIEAEVTGIRKGPVVTMFEILPAPGVRLSKIANLSDNIALRLAASSVRIVAPIPGKHAVGIEVPNEKRSIVSLREIAESEVFLTAKAEVPVALGKDIAGGVQFIDLTQTPHLLIAGSTGSGKSVCVNSIILSILFRRSPEEVKLMLIDPKIVELKLYNDVPHLLTPVITEPKRAFQALQYCICEMERRYAMLDRLGVRDIRSYNRKVKEKGLMQERLPYIVVVVDEFADLMATTGKELESTLARLAAMSRAVGIHLVLATQRPSIDVITGLIKANIPSRIAFQVSDKFNSRIIIDMVGAEKLLGKGDMLFASAWDPFPIRMQGAFVSEEEVERAVEFVKTLGEPEYIDDDIFIDDDEDEGEPNLFDDGDGDPLFEQALEIVLQQGKASASFIQRKLKIGYNRAARIVELMEEKGIVGKAQGSKPRDLVRNPEIAHVRNPSITGLGGAAGVSSADGAGISRNALREMDPADEDADGGPLTVAARAGSTKSGSAAAAAGLPPLVGNLETVPGQRVTGRDEE